MNAGRLALTIMVIAMIAVPASASFPTPERHPGSCIAIYNRSKATLNVQVLKPNDYSGVVWKIRPNSAYDNSLGVTLQTLSGPIVSSEGDWEISVDPAPNKVGWKYVPEKTQSCAGTWSASLSV